MNMRLIEKIHQHIEAWLILFSANILMGRNGARAPITSRADNNAMWYMAEKLQAIAKRIIEDYPGFLEFHDAINHAKPMSHLFVRKIAEYEAQLAGYDEMRRLLEDLLEVHERDEDNLVWSPSDVPVYEVTDDERRDAAIHSLETMFRNKVSDAKQDQ